LQRNSANGEFGRDGNNMKIKTKETKMGDFIVIAICVFVILLCIMPMLNLLAQSLSSSQSVINNKVSFLPVIHNHEKNEFHYGMTMESYRYVFLDPLFTRSMWWTAILTVICTLFSLGMTILCSYPLTYDWLKGKTFINTIIIFTMYFSAGTIPNYILMKSLNLLNNPLVLIIPNCLSVFNMIILRSFFFGIPDSLRESAEIDGANPFTVLVKIYLPLSAPVLATLALFYAVGRWNGFGDALLYINAPQWVPIQLKLWQLINNMTAIDISTVEMVAGTVPRTSDAIKAAAIMFATVPILIVYPWLQRYFIAGVTIGAVKG